MTSFWSIFSCTESSPKNCPTSTDRNTATWVLAGNSSSSSRMNRSLLRSTTSFFRSWISWSRPRVSGEDSAPARVAASGESASPGGGAGALAAAAGVVASGPAGGAPSAVGGRGASSTTASSGARSAGGAGARALRAAAPHRLGQSRVSSAACWFRSFVQQSPQLLQVELFAFGAVVAQHGAYRAAAVDQHCHRQVVDLIAAAYPLGGIEQQRKADGCRARKIARLSRIVIDTDPEHLQSRRVVGCEAAVQGRQLRAAGRAAAAPEAQYHDLAAVLREARVAADGGVQREIGRALPDEGVGQLCLHRRAATKCHHGHAQPTLCHLTPYRVVRPLPAQ